MAQGAARLCMPAITPGLMRALIKGLLAVDRDWVPRKPGRALFLRSSLIATEASFAVRPSRRCVFFIIASPMDSGMRQPLLPMRVCVEDRQVPTLLAQAEAIERRYDRVLWTEGPHRHVKDMGAMSLVVALGDEVVTPALSDATLGGAVRDAVLTLCRAWGLRVSERSVTVDEILGADRNGRLCEMFGCGAYTPITPIRELDCGDRRVVINGGEPGALASRLFHTISDIQCGAAPDSFGWLTPIE
jgi:branched-chain amino acid aminotransferase